MIADFECRGKERESAGGFCGDGVCVVVCGWTTEAETKFKCSAHSDSRMPSETGRDGGE